MCYDDGAGDGSNDGDDGMTIVVVITFIVMVIVDLHTGFHLESRDIKTFKSSS